MFAINGSADSDLPLRIHNLYDLNQLRRSKQEVISIPSDDLLELESSMESITQELEGEEMEVTQLPPIVMNSESEHPVYRAASPPAAPPRPSRSSLITSVEPPASRDLCEANSGDSVPSYVVMACSHCFVYVMVSTANPKCPNCGLHDLLDVLKLLPAMKK